MQLPAAARVLETLHGLHADIVVHINDLEHEDRLDLVFTFSAPDFVLANRFEKVGFRPPR